MSHAYQPIDCALHDCFELACLHHYQVKLELRDQSTIEGKCITTETHPDKSEWLVCKTQYQYLKIRLDQIRKMVTKSANSLFSEVNL